MIKNNFRNQFLAGISVLLPAFLSFYVCLIMFRLLGKILYPLMIKIPVLQAMPILVTYIISIVALIFLVWLVGVMTRNYIGKRLIRLTESLVMKAPVLNHIYEGIRQIVHTIAVTKTAFRRVVLLEYPRKGLFSLAFVTNVMGEKNPRLSLFIPTTPNPTSGLYIIAKEADTIALDMSIEEGMKLVASAGIVTPEELCEKILKRRLD